MNLKLSEVFAQAGQKRVALVIDGPVHYLVLNTKVNAINPQFIKEFNACLDTLESLPEEPAILVMIGSGPKVFCAGFDLKHWAANPINSAIDLMEVQGILARLIKLGIPSMSVVNGHAIAGGVFLALTQDHVVMKSDPTGMIWLNELTFGKAVPINYLRLVKELTNGRQSRTLLLGTKVNPQEAKRLDLV